MTTNKNWRSPHCCRRRRSWQHRCCYSGGSVRHHHNAFASRLSFVHMQVAVAVPASKAVWFNESAFHGDKRSRSSAVTCIWQKETISKLRGKRAQRQVKRTNVRAKRARTYYFCLFPTFQRRWRNLWPWKLVLVERMMDKPGNAHNDTTSQLHCHGSNIHLGTHMTNESAPNNVEATTSKGHPTTRPKMHYCCCWFVYCEGLDLCRSRWGERKPC